MSVPCPIEPSRAELMERVRLKISGKFVVLFPAVSKQIERLKDEKRLQSLKRPDDEHVTITHADLTNAVKTGVPSQVDPATDGSGWNLTVNGKSMEGKLGRLLTVSVYLPNDDNDECPLAIMSFDLLPEETEIEDLV